MKNRERDFFRAWRDHRYHIHKEMDFSSMRTVTENLEFEYGTYTLMLEGVPEFLALDCIKDLRGVE